MKRKLATPRMFAAAALVLACTTAIGQVQVPAKPAATPIAAAAMAPTSTLATTAVARPPALDLGDCPDVADAFELGKSYSCACPDSAVPDPAAGAVPIYGAQIYTGDSNICLAALHAGAMKPNVAARVAVVMVDSPAVFRGTTQNGVKSQVYATSTPVAFRFVPVN